MTVAEDATTTDAIRVDSAATEKALAATANHQVVVSGVTAIRRHAVVVLAQDPKETQVLAAEARPEVRRLPDAKDFHPTAHQGVQKVRMSQGKDAREEARH